MIKRLDSFYELVVPELNSREPGEQEQKLFAGLRAAAEVVFCEDYENNTYDDEAEEYTALLRQIISKIEDVAGVADDLLNHLIEYSRGLSERGTPE